MPILDFQHVRKDYVTGGERVTALQGVSLTVEPGEFVALAGRSGCGKSTLLHLAGAMDFPTSGAVIVDGQDTARLDDAGLTRLRRTRVGFIFQAFQLLNTLNVAENVELPLLLAGAAAGARGRALECLDAVDMSAFARRMPYQLSGGQMQRVAIARALVHRPAVLLADEPTGNLDSHTGDAILELLRGIAGRGTALVMATHSAEAAALAHRMVRMHDGRVTAVDEPVRR